MSDLYAVIGNPIGHTKSPLIHTAFAEQTGQPIHYTAIEGSLGGFAGAVDAFRAAGGRGLNITAPFKLDAFAYATDLTAAAQVAGAVNAMKFDGDRVLADNFDGVGLVRDIIHNLACPIAGRRVLLLGAGGAARGALPPILAEKPSHVVIVNRTFAKARQLAEAFAHTGPVDAEAYSALRDQPFDIILNATSASQCGEFLPVHGDIFAPDCLAYELVYGKGLTPFLKMARDNGVRRLVDGVGMLVEQAAEAFVWWRGVRPDTRPVIEKLTVPLLEA
ncbi:MAG: shikimate dehydrogenase [Candidatus Competibacter denitrificans]|jgi:shikimate dehydrogenase